MSPTLNFNPTFFVISLLIFLDDYRFTMLQLQPLIKWYLIQISIIRDNLSSQVVDKRRHGFDQRMNSSIIHDIICSLLHKRCHPNSYHSDVTYHMILDIRFSVGFLYVPWNDVYVGPSLVPIIQNHNITTYEFKLWRVGNSTSSHGLYRACAVVEIMYSLSKWNLWLMMMNEVATCTM